MTPQFLTNRFDIFEWREIAGTRFLVCRGSYRCLSDAEEKLQEFAVSSASEFYVKDLQLGNVVAHANAGGTVTEELVSPE